MFSLVFISTLSIIVPACATREKLSRTGLRSGRRCLLGLRCSRTSAKLRRVTNVVFIEFTFLVFLAFTLSQKVHRLTLSCLNGGDQLVSQIRGGTLYIFIRAGHQDSRQMLLVVEHGGLTLPGGSCHRQCVSHWLTGSSVIWILAKAQRFIDWLDASG